MRLTRLTRLSLLRELVHGLMRTPLLERGLSAAVEDLADRMPIRTLLDVDAGVEAQTLPRAVELTAYFVVAEALANAVKHARATTVHVELRRLKAGLRVDVLGGILTVHSPRSNGTHIAAEIPLA